MNAYFWVDGLRHYFGENKQYSLATFARCTTVAIDVWLLTKMSIVTFLRKCIANIFR
jgi:hypothetical protein